MIKKQKSFILNIVFSLIMLLVAFILIGRVYAGSYNPSKRDFLSAKAKNLLGKEVDQSGTFWNELLKGGQLTCFWHKESNFSGQGMNNKIHSVFDISFDETKGVMKVDSIMDTSGKKETKTSYADGKNTSIGKLAAEAARDHNAFYVQKALREAIEEGTVVKETNIAGEMDWKDPGYDVDNEAKQKKITAYNQYKKITKETTKAEAKEQSETVTINGKSYTVIGPLKMTYRYKGIKEVTVANAKWTNENNSEDIYWRQQKEKKDGKWTYTKWNNDFNDKDGERFKLNSDSKSFYIAVETSKLPENGQYNITIKQSGFEYNEARIVVCVGQQQQQSGLYAYDNNPHSVNGQIQWTIKRTVQLGELKIVKKDKITGQEINGGQFKLYATLNDGTKGIVSGDAAGTKSYGAVSVEQATKYPSQTVIKNLKYGTYDIWESVAPEGYDITKQKGYNETYKMAFLGQVVVSGNQQYTFSADNGQVVEIEGDVWSNKPEAKVNTIESKRVESSKLLEGITVNFYDGNQATPIATTKTDSQGHYKFTTKNASTYTGEDKNIYYTDLVKGYVEFIYDNKEYITVEPSTGNETDTSKAQEYEMTAEKLDDNNLTGTTGNNPGRAVTNRQIGLAGYYDNKTFKASNINLGLIQKHTPEYSVNQTLAYVKVTMNGYEYTYKYDDAPATVSKYVPKVSQQMSASYFTAKMYPTDIVYNIAEKSDELKVYAVYSIAVTNTETVYYDNLYTEQRLYLESLKDSYDTDRFELCTDKNNSDKSDFALWSTDSEGNASYDVDNANSVFKDGIEKSGTKTSYIQFKLKDDAVKQILERNLQDEQLAKAPTVAVVEGYHEYLRTDNLWVHSNNVRAFNGAKGTNSYPTQNDAKKKYYVHKSIEKTQTSGELYLRFELGESRKLSGTVFEDTKTSESANNNTNLGNGIIDSSENNRGESVTVELLDEKKELAKLYQEKDGKVVYDEKGNLPDAKTQTKSDGTYEFDGVAPGYYYIRFTYGDGTQKIMPENKDILSNDYKSTIINTTDAGDIIKNAMDVTDEQLAEAKRALPANQTEAQKKIVEWYKYLNNTNYSTAIDNLSQREDYVYTEGKTYNEAGEEVDLKKLINAYTPVTSISIENDTNNSTNVEGEGENPTQVQKAEYKGFNFGIIKQGTTNLKLDKKITNIKFTTQTGTTLVSANPTDRTAQYVTALDKVDGGSKRVKMEIEQNLIYGSGLETTYNITISNNSTIDYNGEEYYKYGKGNDKKKINIQEVKDTLDSKYDCDAASIDEIVNGKDSGNDIKISKSEDNNLTMTNWTPIASGESTSVTYTAKTLLSSDNDTSYENNAQVTKITLAKLSTLETGFNWDDTKDQTSLAITQPTGSDRRNTYWIAGFIGLIVLATGLVFIKKKVLKK